MRIETVIQKPGSQYWEGCLFMGGIVQPAGDSVKQWLTGILVCDIIGYMGRPKSQYGRKLSAMVSTQMLAHLLAIGYLNGHGHEYAASLRMLLRPALKAYIDGLGEKERKDFDEILRNVYLLALKEEPKDEDYIDPGEEIFRPPRGIKV